MNRRAVSVVCRGRVPARIVLSELGRIAFYQPAEVLCRNLASPSLCIPPLHWTCTCFFSLSDRNFFFWKSWIDKKEKKKMAISLYTGRKYRRAEFITSGTLKRRRNLRDLERIFGLSTMARLFYDKNISGEITRSLRFKSRFRCIVFSPYFIRWTNLLFPNNFFSHLFYYFQRTAIDQ